MAEFAETSRTPSDGTAGRSDEASVSSSLEHLVAGSQGVITKRIDLALLEGRELLSSAIERGVLVGAGVLMAAAAWFALAGACVLVVLPDAGPAIHLGAFGLLNGGGALGLVGLAKRQSRPQTPARRNGKGAATAA